MVRPHPEGGARAKAFAVSAALRCVRPSRKPAPAQALPYLHRFLKMSRNNDLHQTAPCASPSAGNDPKSRLSLSLRVGIVRCVDTVALARGEGWGEGAHQPLSPWRVPLTRSLRSRPLPASGERWSLRHARSV